MPAFAHRAVVVAEVLTLKLVAGVKLNGVPAMPREEVAVSVYVPPALPIST